jgi:hypothetical protein
MRPVQLTMRLRSLAEPGHDSHGRAVFDGRRTATGNPGKSINRSSISG